MTQDTTITAREVESELPADWRAENDGDETVYAYAGSGPRPRDVPASVTIERVETGEWMATWQTPNSMRGGLHEPTASATDTKGEAIRWVAEKALEIEDE